MLYLLYLLYILCTYILIYNLYTIHIYIYNMPYLFQVINLWLVHMMRKHTISSLVSVSHFGLKLWAVQSHLELSIYWLMICGWAFMMNLWEIRINTMKLRFSTLKLWKKSFKLLVTKELHWFNYCNLKC